MAHRMGREGEAKALMPHSATSTSCLMSNSDNSDQSGLSLCSFYLARMRSRPYKEKKKEQQNNKTTNGKK